MSSLNFANNDDLLSEIKDWIEQLDKELNSKELNKVISKLQKTSNTIHNRERAEQKRKEEEEKARLEQERLEKEQAHIEEVTCMDLPLDWENIFDSDERTRGVHADSIPDGLILSLTTLGRVDIEYISSVTGEDYKTVIGTLKGSIFQNPTAWDECFFKGWETSEEYLSGNIVRKLHQAREANEKYNGYFSDNIKALEKVLPPQVPTEDIYITLGSPWIPPDIIDDFIEHLFGIPQWLIKGPIRSDKLKDSTNKLVDEAKTIRDEITGTWEIPYKTRFNNSIGVKQTYGTDKMGALYILEKTLNMRSVKVNKQVPCPTNKTGVKRVVDEKETLAVIEKQEKLIKEFKNWVWKNPRRKERLEIIFENKYSSVRKRTFDGSFLDFPGMSPNVSLYPYQKNAVARILFTPNTLLAHNVGAGKTYVMIAAGQELRRMGLSKKNMYVVPNNIIGQWEKIFKEMYPNANLLIVDPKSFKPNKREKVLERIQNEDFDGIIIAYSCFERIPISKDYYKNELEMQKKEIELTVKNGSALHGNHRSAPLVLRRKKEKINKQLSELNQLLDDLYTTIYFDDLNITRLFVDEAHNYKNLRLESRIDNVLGINTEGSKKCEDMLNKVRIVQKANNGEGVVFATGTPITNSITDAFVIQKYLQSGELALLDLNNFDSWVGMFAEKKEEFEVDVDTTQYRLATRFAKFHNMPELTSLLSMIADFHQVDQSAGVPECDGYSDALISKTKDFERYLKQLSDRANMVRARQIPRSVDNMLKITTDGRKAALDLRLVDPNAQSTFQSKVVRCAENVTDIYKKTMQDKSAQLIFCDTSVPKDTFNIYDELKDLLVNNGIPSDEIAYVHDATTAAKRNDLFRRTRTGEIRILIGSTFKLGLGVNVQDRLIALHHIDVPWRPADMVQREGRILRQGNMNPKVKIFRYITEGSFDAYSWQLLETKQNFISKLLSGSLEERSGAEIEDTVLDYAEVKALAVGNPRVKERVEKVNELNRYRMLQRQANETKEKLQTELLELPGLIANQENKIVRCKNDAAFERKWVDINNFDEARRDKRNAESRKQIRETIANGLKGHYLEIKEKKLINYRGFDIVLPANMTKEKPFVYLKREGKYYVELGDTETGNLIRIDNYLDILDEKLKEYEKGLTNFKMRKADIEDELEKKENYYDRIKQLKNEVKQLDEALGVKIDE